MNGAQCSVKNDLARWYAVRTHVRQEDRAEKNLKVSGIETFCPRFKDHRVNQFTSAPIYVIKPLFPRYVFAKFAVDSWLHKVSFMRGVVNVVSFGGNPTSIDDEIIDFIRSQSKEDGLVHLGQPILVGDQVIIKDGLFKNLVGIFDRETKDSDRVLILLANINYHGHVAIEKERIRKVV